MRKIDRLISGAIIPPFGIAFVVLTFVVFLNEFGRLSELLITRNASPGTIAFIAGTILPSIVIFSLPLAYLIGVLVGFGGLSGESQITALRACGVSLGRLLQPVLALAGVACALTAVLSLVVMPATNDKLRSLKDRISVRQATSQVQARVFNEDFPNLVFYIDDLSIGRQRWSGVFLSDTTDPKAPRTVLAREGSWVTDAAGTRLQLHLENGVVYEVDPEDPGRDKISVFSATDVPVEISRERVPAGPGTQTRRIQKPEEISTLRLWRGVEEASASERLEQNVELHRRLAIPLSVLGFGLLGLSLGVSTRKGGRTSGFVLSLVIVVSFYVAFLNGLRLARSEMLPPWLGAWAANALLCAIGAVSLAMAERSRSMAGIFGGWSPKDQFARWFPGIARGASPPGMTGVSRVVRSSTTSLLRLRFPRLLDLYVSRGFAVYFLWSLLVCTLLFIVLTLFDLLDDIIRNRTSPADVVAYFVFLTPQILMLVVPMSVLLAVLINFGILERHSEVTALKAGGWSLYRISVPIFLLAGLFCANLYFLQDYVLPYANIRQDSLRNVIKGRPARTSLRPQRKWVFGESNRVFNYDYFDAGYKLFVRLNVFEMDMRGLRLQRRIHAERARIEDSGDWILEDGWIRVFGEENGFHPVAKTTLRFPERASYFQAETFQPKESAKLTYLELNEYIKYLTKTGYNATELKVALHRKIAFPLSCAVMAFLAVPFSFSMGRRGAFFGITLSIAIAISYWGIFSVFEKMGAFGLLVPLLAAWAPNILFAAAGLVLLFTIRT